MNKTNNNKKYAVYARKSSEAEDRQMLSLPAQSRELEEIRNKLSLDILVSFVESKSAKSPNNRSEFNSMLESIEKKEINSILVWSPDRLSRNPVDAGKIIYLMDQELLQEVRTPTQTFTCNPNDKFMLNQLMIFAKLENDNKGVNVKRGLKTKCEMGWYPFVAPIGYLNTPDREKGYKIIVKDHERFDLMRKGWDLILTGMYTVPQVLNKLNNDWGLRTVKRKKIGGTPLSRSGLYDIFTNPFYYGWFSVKGKLYRGKHPPMVSKEEFDKVQEILGRGDAPRPRLESHKHSFTGMIKCGICGCSITATRKIKHYPKTGNTQIYYYYHCTKKNKDVDCTQGYVKKEDLEAQVLETLDKIEIHPKFKEWAIKYLQEANRIEYGTREEVMKNLQKERNNIQEKLDKLLDMRLAEQLSEDEYKVKKKSLLEDKISVQERIKNWDTKADKWMKDVEDAFDLAITAVNRFRKGDWEEKRYIFSKIGSNFVLNNGKVDYDLKKPYFVLKNAGEGKYNDLERLEPVASGVVVGRNGVSEPEIPSWLPGLDSNQQPIA